MRNLYCFTSEADATNLKYFTTELPNYLSYLHLSFNCLSCYLLTNAETIKMNYAQTFSDTLPQKQMLTKQK